MYRRLRKQFKAPCRELGKTERSECCQYYTPDYGHVTASDPQLIIDLFSQLQHIPQEAKHAIAYALVNEEELARVTERVRGVAMRIGHSVAIQIMPWHEGEDFVANWAHGYVMGISRDSKFLLICAKSRVDSIFDSQELRRLFKGGPSNGLHGTRKKAVWWVQYMFEVDSPSFLSRAQFNEYKKGLVKAGRINPVDRSRLRHQFWRPINEEQAASDDYIPPSLADVPADWLSDVKIPHLSKDKKVSDAQYYNKLDSKTFQFG